MSTLVSMSSTAAAEDDGATYIDLSSLKRAKILWPSPSTSPSAPPAHLFEPGAVLCLYFSASWCPPCRAFSPRLAAAYEKMKAKAAGNAKKKDDDNGDGEERASTSSCPPTAAEIFLIGFDRSKREYEQYASQMPFPAIAWDDEAGAREQLAAAASLRGIPTLLLVRGSDGKILQSDGKTRVLRDPGLEGWPWEGIAPTTNLLSAWGGLAQWVLLGLFYVAMKYLSKNFKALLQHVGW
jgi:thiol-disulfide isomerase/thioredoxin